MIQDPYLWLIGGITVLLLGVGLVLYILDRRQTSAAKNWPEVPGTIESGNVRPLPDNSGSPYEVELAYSYSVGSDYYSGYYRCRFKSEDEGLAYVKRMHGTRISVRYQPSAPEVSRVDLD